MKALVLAGGFPQIALIQELKRRNIEVVLADYNAEPVAKKYADKYYQKSTLDIDAIREIAIREEVDFLITVCTDQALHTVAKVSEELDLPCYINYQTALNVTNKQYMKEVLSERGIPTAKFAILSEFDEAVISPMQFPLIVKPVDCNSSKGVRRCNDLDELKEYFRDAIAYSRTHTAIIEEFIDGIEVSVDVYVEDGIAHVLCISESKKIEDKDRFVIFRALWPSSISRCIAEQINLIAQKVADSFDISNSPMLIQFIVDSKNAYVIELSARTGGAVKYLLVKRTSGFDPIKAVVDLTLGGRPHVGDIRAEQEYLINDFIYCQPGIFDHLEGFDELLQEGILKDYYMFKGRGAELSQIQASGDRVAGYTITATTKEELIDKHNHVRNRIKIISSDGKDMIRRDLLTPLSRANDAV